MPIKITVRKNGPLFIHPDEVDQVTLVDHEGNVIEPPPGKGIALCTHSKIGFQAGEKAREEFAAQQAREAQPQERDAQR